MGPAEVITRGQIRPSFPADFVVPAHGLDDVFDVIVMSFEELTDDKPALCDIALDRLGFTGPRSDALLIDNRLDLVEAWRDVGGTGYWFRAIRNSERTCRPCSSQAPHDAGLRSGALCARSEPPLLLLPHDSYVLVPTATLTRATSSSRSYV